MVNLHIKHLREGLSKGRRQRLSFVAEARRQHAARACRPFLHHRHLIKRTALFSYGNLHFYLANLDPVKVICKVILSELQRFLAAVIINRA